MTSNAHPATIVLASEPDFVLGELRVRPSLREVSGRGQDQTLEPRVMQVLVALALRRGTVVSRDQLVERCWSGRAVGEDAINRCIARIRRLSEILGGFDVETIARVGFRLTEAAGFEVPAAPAPLHTARRPAAANSRRWLFPSAAVVLLAAVAAALIGLFSLPNAERISAAGPAAPAALTRPRVAVLPFQNFSPDRANAFFADGIQADILSALAMRAATLEVVPRTTMMTYQVAPQPIARVAADLQATHVVEGSVRRTGESVRLTVQLVDTRTQQYIWSQTYDRKLADALTLQAEVAGDIVSQLAGNAAVSSPELVAPTANAEAYDFYLRAKLLQDDDAWSDAIPLLDQALTRDSKFGAAYEARAQSHYFMIVDNVDDSEQRLARGHEDLDAARRLLGDAAPSVLALDALLSDLDAPDHGKAIHRLEAAGATGLLDSTSVSQLATLLMLDDRLEDAIAILQVSAARDPGNMQILAVLAAELGLARRPVEAMRARDLLLNRYPDAAFLLQRGRLIFTYTGKTDAWRTAADQNRNVLTDSAAIYRTYWDLLRFERRYADLKRALDSVAVPTLSGSAITSGGFSLCCVGRRPTAVYRGWANLLSDNGAAAESEGRSVLEFVAKETPTRWNDWFLRTLSAEGLLLAGKPEPAMQAAREALALMPRNGDTLRWRYASAVAARVFAWAGAADEAVALLEQLATLKPGLGPAEIARDPLYSIPLAGNPRYRTLVERLEIEMEDFDAEFRNMDVKQVAQVPASIP